MAAALPLDRDTGDLDVTPGTSIQCLNYELAMSRAMFGERNHARQFLVGNRFPIEVGRDEEVGEIIGVDLTGFIKPSPASAGSL